LIERRENIKNFIDSLFEVIKMMEKRALLVGIENYDNFQNLEGCVNDVRSMRALLEQNEDKSPNYECQILVTEGSERVTRRELKVRWNQLFENFSGDVLFYYSGHGTPTSVGGYLVTQEGDLIEPGLAMHDLIVLANRSKARSILLILDCCYSGDIGNPANMQSGGSIENLALLREGVTILAASRATQTAALIRGQSVFTNLMSQALSGAAADVRGRVSAASIYGYVEQSLGAFDQRPVYKSHADNLPPVRKCKPAVSDDLLRELPSIFSFPDSDYEMNPSYEFSNTPEKSYYKPPTADPEKVIVFNKFKALRNAGLLTTCSGKDLFFVAMDSEAVKLTLLGQFYWQLAKAGRI
jgi:hypothetical protein